MNEFKKFISKGNVIDMAVGLIMDFHPTKYISQMAITFTILIIPNGTGQFYIQSIQIEKEYSLLRIMILTYI